MTTRSTTTIHYCFICVAYTIIVSNNWSSVEAAFGMNLPNRFSRLATCTNINNNNDPHTKYVTTTSHLEATKKRKGAMGRKKSASSSGFGKEDVEEQKQEEDVKISTENIKEGTIYSMPSLYDLAFGYRNFEEEVKFLLYAHQTYSSSGTAPKHILELAAGPARHSMASLMVPESSVESVTALDLSPDMVEYAQDVARHELPVDQQEKLEIQCGDMRQPYKFNDNKAFDSAWILLGSMAHLTTNNDVIDCFRSACQSLVPGGTLIVELSHPRETFSMVECTRNGWEVPLEDDSGEEYGELQIIWGDDDDYFDPITQVRNFTVSMKLDGIDEESLAEMALDNGDLQSVKQVVPMRLFTSQEIDALARCSGFEVAAMYGALCEEVEVNDGDEAFRLVCVLRKTE